MATGAHTERALVAANDLHDLGDILGVFGHDHAPRRLGGVEGVVLRQTLIVL